MCCVWTLPGQPPDSAALERMRRHFSKPTELMPVPWFISGEINFHTWLAEESPEDIDARSLGEAFSDIGSGLLCFPEVDCVPTWKAWFKYLLAYAIVRANEMAQDSSLLPYIINTLMVIYPQDIVEEYEGFRTDVVSALGTRTMPQTLARDDPKPNREDILIINDIWDYSFFFSEGPCEELSLPVLFCLKYFRPLEIEVWVTSFLEIDNAQFHLEFILWWLAFNRFSRQAHDWPTDGDLSELLERAGLVASIYPLPPFHSFDVFIPVQNRVTFQNTLARELSFDKIQQWSVDIRTKADYLSDLVEQVLQDFSSTFFHLS